jgi:hypothetical protein
MYNILYIHYILYINIHITNFYYHCNNLKSERFLKDVCWELIYVPWPVLCRYLVLILVNCTHILFYFVIKFHYLKKKNRNEIISTARVIQLFKVSGYHIFYDYLWDGYRLNGHPNTWTLVPPNAVLRDLSSQ